MGIDCEPQGNCQPKHMQIVLALESCDREIVELESLCDRFEGGKCLISKPPNTGSEPVQAPSLVDFLNTTPERLECFRTKFAECTKRLRSLLF